MKIGLMLACSLALFGCAHTHSLGGGPTHVAHVDLPDGVTIRIENEPSEAIVARVLRQDLPSLLSQTARWGTLREAVVIRIHSTSEGFRAAIPHGHHDWINGWATNRSVDLLSPRAAGVERWRDQLREVVLHELTHVIFFQNAQLSDDWRTTAIPFWFVEGMAVCTANPTVQPRDWAWVRSQKFGLKMQELLNPSPLALKQQPALVYGAAAVAFEALTRLKGEAGVRKIISGLSNGKIFSEVFRRVYDRSIEQVVRSWGSQIGQEF